MILIESQVFLEHVRISSRPPAGDYKNLYLQRNNNLNNRTKAHEIE